MIGDIVFCRFPFADKACFKSRPCLVISQADELGDLEVLKITCKQIDAPGRIPIQSDDFLKGGLDVSSAVVPTDLAKTHVSAIVRYAGQVRPQLVQAILKARIRNSTRTFSRLAHTANRPGDDALREENAAPPIFYLLSSIFGCAAASPISFYFKNELTRVRFLCEE